MSISAHSFEVQVLKCNPHIQELGLLIFLVAPLPPLHTFAWVAEYPIILIFMSVCYI